MRKLTLLAATSAAVLAMAAPAFAAIATLQVVLLGKNKIAVRVYIVIFALYKFFLHAYR